MKKTFLLFIILGIALIGNAQLLVPKGIKIGKVKTGTSIITVDSLTQQSTDQFVIWKGATVLQNYLPEGSWKIGTTSVIPTAAEINMMDSIDVVKGKVQKQIDLKLAKLDTTAMLAIYARTQRMLDSIVNLRNSISLKLDTIAAAIKYVKVADGFVLTDTFYTEPEVNAKLYQYEANEYELLKSLGANFRNMSVGTSIRNGLNSALVDGTLQLQLQYKRPYAYTIDTLTWVQGTSGVYTADNENRAGVYSYNLATDTYTLVASIADDGTLWSQTAGTVMVKPLTTPYTTTANEIIYTAVLYNNSAQTTGPAIVGSNVVQANYFSKEFLNTTYFISAQKTGNATLPASFTAASRTGYCPMIIVK